MSGVPMTILVSGLLGARIAPSAKLATLPLAVTILGIACSTIPAALLNRRLGRKRSGFLGFACLAAGGASGWMAASSASFAWLLAGSALIGASVAFAQQFRFAALESLERPEDAGAALSILMSGGLVAAYVGPELGALGKDLLPSPHGFAGSFALLIVLAGLASVAFAFYREPPAAAEPEKGAGRPLKRLMASPLFLIALGAGAASYVVMSFVMTATPISMQELCGFSLEETKRVIQSHIFAMFLPSLAGGFLIRRVGLGGMVSIGALGFGAAIAFGLAGERFGHFWGALVALGLGWNFLFVGGTALLPRAYEPAERFKAQAANDFVVFGCQAAASLSAGWFLYSFGWEAMLWTCAPVALAALGAGLWLNGLERRERQAAAG